MGLVYADIELITADDIALARRNMMAINETIQEQLNLPFIEKEKALWQTAILRNMM